jgi:autotransporter-associated beta strand protein
VQTFSGTNIYTGTTLVSNGTLLVNGTHTGGAGYTVVSGATLGGSGSTGSTLDISGTLSPGASIESFASRALTMNSGSTFVFEAVDNTSTGADLMAVNGALSLTNVSLDLTNADLDAGTWSVGDKLTLISYNTNTVTSGFAGYANDTTYTFGTNQWLFKYDDSVAGNNYQTQAEATGTQFVTMTLVPEPSSLAMLAFSMLSLWLFRKRN